MQRQCVDYASGPWWRRALRIHLFVWRDVLAGQGAAHHGFDTSFDTCSTAVVAGFRHLYLPVMYDGRQWRASCHVRAMGE